MAELRPAVKSMATLFKNLFKSPINRVFAVIHRSATGRTPFPQFQNLPPHYPINGTGSTLETKIIRKRQVVDPNVPNFVKQERLLWSDWKMLRDCRRRYIFARYHPMRTILYTIRKTKLLPSNIQEVAHEETVSLPRESMIHWLNNRCIISSRPRGNLKRYKISRHMFRGLADYNQLSGVAKASW